MFGHTIRIPRAAVVLGALVSLVALGAPAAGAQFPQRARPLSGVAYTIHVGGAPHAGSGMAAAMASPSPTYTASAIFAAGRGRLDILEGGVESLFAKGDYVLFDSTDLVIVHPATREFVPLPRDAADKQLTQIEAMGLKLTIADVKVTIDSVPGSDTVAGRATRHFRMTTAFTMAIDAGAMQQRLATESTTDYWVASIPGMPGNPLLQANGFASTPVSTGMFKELSSRVDSAAARMGSAVALKTATFSRLIQGPGSIVQMQQTSEVSGLKQRDVDESMLILPAGYKQGVLPGTEGAPIGDTGAKWRTLPARRFP
ncbi:MAG: hypothetical protein JWM41_4827 [Gemmatimonadetes bacterium]|nr:hypothetical protein [Gemmatimonadota bacterium]